MALSFEPIMLDSGTEDNEAVLLMRDGMLLAVLTRLSAMHGELAGHWFVEARFRELLPPGDTFAALSSVEDWLAH